MTQYIRSFIFMIFLFGGTGAILFFTLPFYAFSQKNIGWILKALSGYHIFMMRYILKLDVDFEGLDKLKNFQGPFIIACQHQSAFETVAFFHFKLCKFVYKSEIDKIPLFGFFMRKSGMLSVDRDQGSKALKNLLKKAKSVVDEKTPILIFPEGTRISFGQVGEIQAGLWALYHYLKIPVLTISLDSGKLWPANQILKQQGTIHLNCHDPILPGLDREEFDALIKQNFSYFY